MVHFFLHVQCISLISFYLLSGFKLITKFKTGGYLFATFKRHTLKIIAFKSGDKTLKKVPHKYTKQKKAVVPIYTTVNMK